MYLITVIMPVYNAEMYLERAIASVINQSIFKNLELILIDDGSSDSSNEIINSYSDKYSNIKSILLEENHGFPGHARNIGIKNASADYIMFLDSDDEYEYDYCEIMYDTIESYESDVVTVNFRIFNNNSIVMEKDYFSRIVDVTYENDNLKIISLNEFRNILSTALWSKIFKKSIINDNNMVFVENGLNEDSIFLYEYYYYATNLILLNYFGYKHYRHGDNISYYSPKVTLEFIKSYYIILDLVKSKWGTIDTDYLFKDKIQGTIYDIMLTSNQKCLLGVLYKFEKDINFNSSLNHSWSSFVNNLILKRNFSLVLIVFKFSLIFKRILDFFRKLKL